MESKLQKNKCNDFVLHSVDVATIDKILKNLDVAKTSEIDQISVKFFQNGASTIAIHLSNIISLSIKLDTFPSKCKIAKIKRKLRLKEIKKEIKTEA